MSLAKLRPEMAAAIERTLQATLDYPAATPDKYSLMLYYHLGWEHCDQPEVGVGKRARPLITLLAAAAAGGAWRHALPFSAGVELIHNFSLVHDDIQDASELRHGRATVWKMWGKDQAINAGDALFAYAHLALQRAQALSAESRLRATQILDHACIALTQGQHHDMMFESRARVTVSEYVEMVDGKTAALIAAAAELGAVAANAAEAVCTALRDFGRSLGRAFQIRDDLLGIWGEPSVTGKSAATDIDTRKKTLPVVFGIQESAAVAEAYAAAGNSGVDTVSIMELLESCGAREFAERVEKEHTAHALAALEAASPGNSGGEALYELTLQLLGRTY